MTVKLRFYRKWGIINCFSEFAMLETWFSWKISIANSEPLIFVKKHLICNQTCRSIKLLSLSSAQLIVFEFQRRSNSKRMSWVCAQIFEFRLFFFGNNKKGSVSPKDISDLAPEKREGEFTKKKWGRVGRQRVFWAEKLSWAAFILFDFVHRSNSIFLS